MSVPFRNGRETGDPDKQFRWSDWHGFRRESGWVQEGVSSESSFEGFDHHGDQERKQQLQGEGLRPGAMEFRVAVCQLN